MALSSRIKRIIENRIGADIEIIGTKIIEHTVSSEMKKHGASDLLEYEKQLYTDPAVYDSFLEEIVVPKTWFFRNRDAFLYLKDSIVPEWEKTGRKVMKLLSVPCSTGEEAFSLAATLFEAGLRSDQFHIDAMDISRNAIETTEAAVYPKSKTFIEEVAFSGKYIFERDDHYSVDDRLKKQIRFSHINLLDVSEITDHSYDVIFCRNVLIYFNEKTRKKVVINLKKKLVNGGVLFSGHAEMNIFLGFGFVKHESKNTFACRVGKRQPQLERKIITPKKLKHRIRKLSVHLDDPEKKKRAKPESPRKMEVKNTEERIREIKSVADNGDYLEAFRLCDAFQQEMKPNAEVYFIQGLIYQQENDFDRAQNLFEKVLYLNPEHYDALMQMSLLMEQKGRVAQSDLFKKRAKRSYRMLNQPENG